MQIDHAIDIVERDLALARLVPNKAAIARYEHRLADLYAERDAVAREEMEVLRRFRERMTPKRVPPPVLEPMNPDEYLRDDWIIDEANRSRRKAAFQ